MKQIQKYILYLFLGLILLVISLYYARHTREQTNLIQIENTNRLQQYIYTEEADFANFFQRYFVDTNTLYERWPQLLMAANQKELTINIFKNDTLLFWSDNRINSKRYLLHTENGTGFIPAQNGYYLYSVRNYGNYQMVILNELKTHYNYQNEYIANAWNTRLSFMQDAIISTSSNKNYNDIYAINNDYLFSVKLFHSNRTLKNGLAVIILVILLYILIVFHFLFRYLLKIRPLEASVLFFIFSGSVFYLIKHYWYELAFLPANVFSPEIYASSNLINSIGSLSMAILFACWYFFMLNERVRLQTNTNQISIFYTVFFMFLSVMAADSTFDTIRSLVFDSQINFDLNNITHTNFYTLIAIVLSILLLLITFLISSILFRLISKTKYSITLLILCYALIVLYVQPTLLRYLFERGHYYFIESTLYLTALFAYHSLKSKLNRFQGYFVLITLLSFFSSLNLYAWNRSREQENRKLFASKLANRDDMATEYFLKSIEKKIVNDKYVKYYFINNYAIKSIFEKRMRQLYFTGYLSRYEVTFYEFDSSGSHHLQIRNPYSFQQLNQTYIQASKTIDSYCRYLPENSPLKGYLTRIPIIINRHLSGYIFIHLQLKLMQDDSRFDELLIEGYRQNRYYRNEYSFAVYQSPYIVNQSGNYPYRISNLFKVKAGETYFTEFNGYNHLVMGIKSGSSIVVSKPSDPFYAPFALFSVEFTFFTLLLSFNLALYTLSNWSLIRKIVPKGNNIARFIRQFINGFMGMDDPEVVLIRTRIQVSIVLIVFFTLAITAYFTIGYIVQQYNEKQSELLMKKLRSVVSTIEGENIQRMNDSEMEAFINQIGDYYDTDITVYDASGEMRATSIRKIYDDEIISRLMHPNAFYHLNFLKESQFNQTEQIANFNYTAGYVPILKNKNELLGYLQLPYFSKQLDLLKEISSLAFGFINLYALLFITMGLMAFFISRNISNPLILLQQQIAKTTLNKNTAINWKGKDEIGELVRQYNIMISKLEESAQALAQSEREGAWRDIARQIAHEIKNPLTPMKLSIQHLERAWNDKSPKLEETFKKVSRTLILQIETLNELASEFSSFARMPDPIIESIEVLPVVEQVSELLTSTDNAEISINCPEKVEVLFDHGYLTRVLTNLIKNGIQAVPEDRTPKIDIIIQILDKQIEIRVVDNGTGISSDKSEQIFTPYFSTKVSGMGLGLPIVKSMVEACKGSIRFENNKEFGASFILKIPSNVT